MRSEKVVTHGLYLQLYGEEAYRAYDAVRNVRFMLRRDHGLLLQFAYVHAATGSA